MKNARIKLVAANGVRRARPYRDDSQFCDKLHCFAVLRFMLAANEHYADLWFAAVERARRLSYFARVGIRA